MHPTPPLRDLAPIPVIAHRRPTGPQGSHVLTSMLGADARIFTTCADCGGALERRRIARAQDDRASLRRQLLRGIMRQRSRALQGTVARQGSVFEG